MSAISVKIFSIILSVIAIGSSGSCANNEDGAVSKEWLGVVE
jgi:hypothetical protein